MLPKILRGPGILIESDTANKFIEEASRAYPHLDRDFISQLCYELPTHLEDVLPGFDPERQGAFRITRKAKWILDNVLYYDGRSILDEWGWHVDRVLAKGIPASPVLKPMLERGTWSFPPVVIEASFARTLGLDTLGGNYFLIEGTHRISYLAQLVQLGRISSDQDLELIEIRELDNT